MDLVLLTDSYPFGSGELFLDTEVEILSKSFKTIYVCSTTKERQVRRPTPSNIVIIENSSISFSGKLSYLFKALISPILWTEFFSIKSRFHHWPSWTHFKILLADFIQASHLAKSLENFCVRKALDIPSILFYSYWHDVKALSLCFLKLKFPIKAIARGHGWDIDYKRHSPKFLPFKLFIMENLDKTYVISSYSMRVLNNLFSQRFQHKISIARLGVSNSRFLAVNKNKSNFLICSCAVLMKIKRINLIVDLISNLRDISIEWVHFGDGPLNASIREYAETKGVKIKIMGMIDNHQILDFYSMNFVDLFVSLSKTEGVPVSIMEAFSAGIPVLATNVGGCSEIVNEENGFIIDKYFDVYDVSLIVRDYLCSQHIIVQEKRKSAYNTWFSKYNAEVNYFNYFKEISNGKF
jgi:glycosyltransferase involved in cell wall biosynthesis